MRVASILGTEKDIRIFPADCNLFNPHPFAFLYFEQLSRSIIDYQEGILMCIRAMTRFLPVLLAGVCAFVILCGRGQITNPYDPGYVGDYRLSVAWDSLPDTLNVDTI